MTAPPLCSECPLKNTKRKITCKYPIRRSQFAIIGEAPGYSEEIQGEYFIGPSGRELDKALAIVGVHRSEVHINNALRCKAPQNITTEDLRKAINCCLPRLIEELALSGATHALLCGSIAFHALTKYWTAPKGWLGSLMQSDKLDLVCVPTVHPAYILRGQRQYLPIFYTHLDRVVNLASGAEKPYKWPDLYYYGHSADQIISALRAIIRKSKWVGLDIETAGRDPLTVPITAIGVANHDVGVSLAWPIERHFDNDKDRKIALALVKRILSNPKLKKVAHNGVHDLLGLEAQGLKVNGYTHDTLLIHHIVGNTLPHDLGFVAQVEFAIEAWKKIFKVSGDAKGLERFLRAKRHELTEYNAKDTAILPDLTDVLLERLADTHNGEQLYRDTLKTSMISMQMRCTGAKVDIKAVAEHKRKLTDHIKEAVKEFRSLECVPTGFNLNSPKQLNDLFFDTLERTPINYSKKTGKPSLDKDTLNLFCASVDGRVATAAKSLLRYRKWDKLYSTYIKNLELDNDHYIHATPKVWGTKGGRWSYEAPNLQNIPSYLRNIICSRYTDGWILEADYSQLELRIIAYLSGDKRMISWFEDGKDLHTETARIMFNVPSGEPVPKPLRKLAKGINFGDNYGACAETIYANMVQANPQVELSQVAKLLELRHIAHPQMTAWRRKMVQIAHEEDYVECPLSGRRQYFFGQPEPTKCYNYPVQGTASDLINAAIPRVFSTFARKDRQHLIFQVHDALICDTTDPYDTAKTLKKFMEKSVKINGVTRKFPVDYKLGRNWGDCKEFGSPEEIKAYLGEQHDRAETD